MSEVGLDERCAELGERARAVLSEGRPADALPLFEHALALAPLDASLNWLAGLAGLMSGACANAAQRFAIADQLTERSQPQIAAHHAAALHCLGEAGTAGEPEAAAHQVGYGVPAVYDRVFGALLDQGDEAPLRGLIRALLASQWVDDPWWNEGDAVRRCWFRAVALGEIDGAVGLSGRLDPVDLTLGRDFARLAVEEGIPETEMPSLPEIPDGLDGWTRTRLASLVAHEAGLRQNAQREASPTLHLSRSLQDALGGFALPQAGSGSKDDPIVFYHVQVSGGASFSSAFCSLYQASSRIIAGEEVEAALEAGESQALSKLKFLTIHHPVELRKLAPSPRLLWTMARDPVQRAISVYFDGRKTGHPWFAERSFGQFVDTVVLSSEEKSVETLSLAYWLLKSAGDYDGRWPHDVDAAFAVARDRFDFVGVTEYFDAALVICAAMAGSPQVPKWQRLSASGAPPRTTLDPVAIGKLDRVFEAEVDLYRRIRQLFLDRYGSVLPLIERLGSLETRG